jgi:PTS system N-acetylgalactosamine-specific IIA component
MVGFVLTGHGDFSVGLASSVKMIAGPQEEFDVVPFHEDEAGEFPQKLADAIAASAERNDGVIVFCDLMGGTPFNQAMMKMQTAPGVEVVAGTNLPMLLEVLTTRTPESTTQELVDSPLRQVSRALSTWFSPSTMSLTPRTRVCNGLLAERARRMRGAADPHRHHGRCLCDLQRGEG